LIDGGYFAKIGGANLKELTNKLRPAQLVALNGRTAKPEEMFQAAMTFILEQHKLLETPLSTRQRWEASQAKVKTACKANHFSKDS